MTSRERVELALSFKRPDRVPFNFWMDRRLLAQYEEKYGPYFRVEHYGGDVIEVYENLRWPMGETVERDGTVWLTKPMWPDGWEGEKNMAWPNPEDPANFAALERDIRNQPDKAIFLNVAGILCVMHFIESENHMFLDFYERAEEVQAFFRKAGELMARFVTVACDRYPEIAAVYVQDDLGFSHGPMFSTDILEQFVYVANDQPILAAREAEKPVVYHSCGKVYEFVDHLIDLGVCALNPLQPNVNDLDEFVTKYSDRIGVYGGLDSCFIIPDGTPEQVHEHVLGLFEKLGKDGALILSSHDIPPHCPEENIDMLVRTITDECVY